MDFDEIMVKENPGLCRCCLSEGCYKDLSSEYSWMSETEVYADMLFECFDISISQHTDGPNGPNRLICEVCITRLRDACNFKKQVLDSEKKFVDMMAKGDFQNNKAMLYQSQMKAEMSEIEVDQDTEHVDFLDDDLDYDDIKTDDPSMSGDITVAALPIKNKRGRPRKNATVVKSEKKTKLPKTEEKPRSSKVVTKGAKLSTVEDKYKKIEIARKLELKRRNIDYVLTYSNATPFMWYKGKYRCFYCTEPMKNPETLKTHTAKSHRFANTNVVVSDRMKNNRDKDAAIKIDITDLMCTVCDTAIVDLEQFIHHLIIAHDCEYDVNIPNCLLPFKLDRDNPSCATCNMKFVFFEYLLRHANKNHLSHSYICDICGTSFQGENHMKMHHRYYHRKGGYNCEYCNMACTTLSKKQLHEKNVHLINLIACPHCPEMFKSPYFKKLHLANVHGIEDMKFKCTYCSKVYPQESIMSRHMRRVHLREKNVECTICGDKFFSAYEVKLHMAKHNGEKRFMCSVCGKKFTKTSNLKTHLATHNKDYDLIEVELVNEDFAADVAKQNIMILPVDNMTDVNLT